MKDILFGIVLLAVSTFFFLMPTKKEDCVKQQLANSFDIGGICRSHT